MLRFRRATYNWCLSNTHILPSRDTDTFFECANGWVDIIIRADSSNCGLFFKLVAAHQSPPPCGSLQEHTATKGAFYVLNELICPRRLSQRCWMTGTPPGTLPTQTYNCSPTLAAFFALCKPLLCHRSVKEKKHVFKKQLQPLWWMFYFVCRQIKRTSKLFPTKTNYMSVCPHVDMLNAKNKTLTQYTLLSVYSTG